MTFANCGLQRPKDVNAALRNAISHTSRKRPDRAATLTKLGPSASWPIDLEPTRMFLHGLESSARVIESNGRIGYVHVWCYAGYVYQGALNARCLKAR